MKNFKIGQEVLCTHPTGLWFGCIKGPGKNEIVTISNFSEQHKGYLEFKEYPISAVGNLLPDCYNANWFEPLADVTKMVDEVFNEKYLNKTF